jgi:hypothetical protein
VSAPIPPLLQAPPIKGALVSFDDDNTTSTVTFQYNPETLRRTLSPNTVGGDQGDRSRAVRFTGAPVETISVEVVIDATDAMDLGDPVAQQLGVYPQMSALELLLYPSSSSVERTQTALAGGTIEVVPLTAPRLHFVWGAGRVVPVRMTSLTVTEEIFGPNLVPVRATVALEMRVLSYSDVFSDNPDYQVFLDYQEDLEKNAATPYRATPPPGGRRG